jgi:hypothetical protein
LKFLNEVTVSSHFISQVAVHFGGQWWRHVIATGNIKA